MRTSHFELATSLIDNSTGIFAVVRTTYVGPFTETKDKACKPFRFTRGVLKLRVL